VTSSGSLPSSVGCPPVSPPERLPTTFRPGVLTNRSFLCLYSAATGSALGAAVSTVSIVFIVYTRTGSTIAVTFVGLADIAPAVALGLVAGVVADRYNRRWVMIACDGVCAAAIGSLALSFYTNAFLLIP
jgi:MFS family permease